MAVAEYRILNIELVVVLMYVLIFGNALVILYIYCVCCQSGNSVKKQYVLTNAAFKSCGTTSIRWHVLGIEYIFFQFRLCLKSTCSFPHATADVLTSTSEMWSFAS